MKRSICGVLVSIAFMLAIPASGQDHPTFQGLWDAATRREICVPAEYPDFILVTCKGELTLWYFTKPNHPAHPGVIERAFVQENGAWLAREHGYSFGSDDAQPAFKKWLAEIVDLDRQMKEESERRRRAP